MNRGTGIVNILLSWGEDEGNAIFLLGSDWQKTLRKVGRILDQVESTEIEKLHQTMKTDFLETTVNRWANVDDDERYLYEQIADGAVEEW